ncbi:MAG: metallophosphatase, partial [Elusimicrobiota bacterium]|nr:metallophosphatase [Elusimicrobiota bacterium]
MKYFKRLLFVFGVAALSALGYFYYFNSTVKRVDIVYTSDGHGNVLPSVDYSRREPVRIGGLAVLGKYLSRIEKPFLLLDSGDMFQGTPEGILSRGRIVIDLMNILGYHAAAVGNHDFDFGQPALEKLSGIANFPFLGANIITTETGRNPDYIQSHIIYSINKVRVGLIGTITEDMPRISMGKNIEGLEFASPAAAVTESVSELAGKTDIVVLLSHSGLDSDRELAPALEGVDLILGGHSHIPLKRPVIKNNILISQPGCNFKYAGRFTLYYCGAAEKVLTYKNSMTPLYVKDFKSDSRVENIIKEGMEDIQKRTGIKLERVIGESEKRLSNNLSGEGKKHGELALGNWQTDV